MSFIRFIYNTSFLKKRLDEITLGYIFSNAGKIFSFIEELRNETLIDSYEISELRGSEALARHIHNKEEITPYLVDIINDKKRGAEIRKSLLEHAYLIHEMYYNKEYILNQFDKIINELEHTVEIEEKRQNTLRVVSPRTLPLRLRGGK